MMTLQMLVQFDAFVLLTLDSCHIALDSYKATSCLRRSVSRKLVLVIIYF